jgi:hypothetical protein
MVILACAITIAQDKVEVDVSIKEMSQGNQMAYTVLIPESTTKVVKKEWKNFINERSIFEFATKGTSQTFERTILGISNLFSNDKKEYSKKSLKMEERGNELVVYNVLHEDITNVHLDVIAQISAVESGVKLSSFFKYADSVFISESNVNKDTHSAICEYVRQFGVETYKVVVADQVKIEEKELKKQEGIFKDSQRDNRNLDKDIGKYETEIDEYKYNIKTLERDLEGIDERLQEYKTTLRNTEKKSVEYDLVKEVVKGMEKERKKNLKAQKSNKNNIKTNQSNIKKTKGNIGANKEFQEIQQEIISKQMLRVEEFKTKYSNIN